MSAVESYFCIYFQGKADRCCLWIGRGVAAKGRSQGLLGDFDMSSLRTELPSAKMEETEGGAVWEGIASHITTSLLNYRITPQQHS